MEKQYLFVDEHICDICGEKFEKHSLLANHIRWKHNNQDDYIKKISDDKKRRDDIRLGEIKEFVVKCEMCLKEFIVKERELKFPTKEKYYCSLSCANTRQHSAETIKKISINAKLCWKNEDYANKCLKNNNLKRTSSKGEREIRNFLKDIYGNKNVLSHRIIKYKDIIKAVDLTLINENIIIEYDGIWHFNKEIYERLGTPEKYVKVLEKDKKLKEYCEINNTRLLRISDKHYSHNKIKSKLEILDFIEKTDLQYLELY